MSNSTSSPVPETLTTVPTPQALCCTLSPAAQLTFSAPVPWLVDTLAR